MISAGPWARVAITGKTLRRSFGRGAGQWPIHMISAWAAGQRFVGDGHGQGLSTDLLAAGLESRSGAVSSRSA